MKERNITIDYARFIAIILVVLGHLVQYNDVDFDNNYLFKLIYSFHMPLFIFISGFVSFNSLYNKALKKDLKEKFIHILVPFFIWGILLYLVEIKGAYLNLILHPSSAYWFLWVLFWIYSLSKLTIILYKYNKILAFIFIIILYLMPTTYFGYGLIKYLSIYFIFGLFIFRYKHIVYTTLKCMDKKIYIYILITFFLILANFYDRSNALYYNYFSSHALYIKALIYSYKFLLAILGILLIFKTASILNKKYGIESAMLVIGQKYTLAIYVTHYYFLHLYSNENFYLSILLNSIFMGIFLTVLYYALQFKCNRLCQMVFGIPTKRKKQ